MQQELHALSSPHHFHPLQTAKAQPPVGIPDHQLEHSSDARVPSATFTSPLVAGLGEQPQYAYQGNQSVTHHFRPPQHTFDLPIIPGPYYAPLPVARPQMLNDGTVGQPPNVAGPSQWQGTPGPVLPGMSVGEELRQLANRYLHDPDSRVDRVRVRRSCRSGKVKVMILLELDDSDME